MSGVHDLVTALQAQNGSTPLHNAASNGHHEAAEALALHCDCDIQNSNGNTALHVAASKGGLQGGGVPRQAQASPSGCTPRCPAGFLRPLVCAYVGCSTGCLHPAALHHAEPWTDKHHLWQGCGSSCQISLLPAHQDPAS